MFFNIVKKYDYVVSVIACVITVYDVHAWSKESWQVMIKEANNWKSIKYPQ